MSGKPLRSIVAELAKTRSPETGCNPGEDPSCPRLLPQPPSLAQAVRARRNELQKLQRAAEARMDRLIFAGKVEIPGTASPSVHPVAQTFLFSLTFLQHSFNRCSLRPMLVPA